MIAGICREDIMGDAVYSRINYLYQTIEFLTKSNIKSNLPLIHYYSKCMAAIAEKKVLRIDPVIKRRLCKKCHMYQVPGTTCIVRLVVCLVVNR